LKTILRIFLIAAFPFLLFLGWVRLMITPVFIGAEYRRPGFPADPSGFTAEERLRWADISRRYLLSDAEPEYFEPYRLADGSPLYNEREVKHMADVQALVHAAMRLLSILGAVYLAACVFLVWKDRTLLRRTLAAAGLGTFGVLIAIMVVVALAWDWAFVSFHRVFFTGETWLFPYTDTLIRLFPVQFWQDGSAAAVIGMLATCLLTWFAASLLPRWIERRRPRR
jgi:integral membrane protein (TIGR01906 family)